MAGCGYARRYAEADLRAAGVSEDGLKQRAGDLSALPAGERRAVAFARKLTRAGHTVTDGEVAELIQGFGAARVVAMVHTLAHANFQNRIFLATGVAVEPDGPYPPAEWGFDRERLAKVAAPARPAWDEVVKRGGPDGGAKPGWRDRPFADILKALEGQKGRKGRIAPLPPGKLAHLAPTERRQAERIVWSNVSMGYQPALTRAWFGGMRTFHEEAKLDRTFTGSLFWVTTRSNECFY